MNRLQSVGFSGLALLAAAACGQDTVSATDTAVTNSGPTTSAPGPATPATATDVGPMPATPGSVNPGPVGPTPITTVVGPTGAVNPVGPTGAVPTTPATGPTAGPGPSVTAPGPQGMGGATGVLPQPTANGAGGAGGGEPAPSAAGGAPVTPEPVEPGGIDPATFAPDLDGFYWEGTCVGNGGDGRQCAVDSGFDPNNVGGCTVNLDKSMTINGDAATKYIMEVEVRGLLGSRCYTGGTRRAGDAPVNWTGANDGLYIGGSVPSNWWNSYEVLVMGGPQGEPTAFYLNSYYDNPSASISFDAQTCTMEEILEVNYTFDVPVMGNSTLLFRINDQNCQAQMNCGAYNGVKECPTPRTVDLVGMNPPATFEQPPINAVGGNLFYPQWAYFDVKSVVVAE